MELEYINYSIPQRFDTATDTVEDSNGLRVWIDFEAEQRAADSEVADEVAAAALTWQFKDELTADEYNRLALLNKLLTQQLNGKTVGKATIERALMGGEFADYEHSLTQPITSAELLYAEGVPDVLKRYNIKLREADFQYNKYERLADLKSVGRANYKRDTLSKTYNKSEHLYELALEYLQEQIELSQQNGEGDRLTRWLDRDVDFTTAGNLGIDVDGVPRVKGSTSHYALDAGLPKLSVRLKREQCVLQSLLRAAVACAYVPEVVAVVQVQPKLKTLDMSKLHPERD
ncbi:hypothetical protein [Limnohabitans parvus]|uniref:hypothetical protein n=1 Tax=Limnohabitans parvus TaxID=540061 RepID=UPI0011B213E0|nr:hypothetical protein [Limnohabitans parvus]